LNENSEFYPEVFIFKLQIDSKVKENKQFLSCTTQRFCKLRAKDTFH